jgi:hypothetical protein
MNARNAMIRPSTDATRTAEGPNGLSQCFHCQSRSVHAGPLAPKHLRTRSTISVVSAGVARRTSVGLLGGAEQLTVKSFGPLDHRYDVELCGHTLPGSTGKSPPETCIPGKTNGLCRKLVRIS